MARKRKGRDISGWLVIDKPAGITSNAVVNKVRWAFNANKAGHAGTLDPDATGVLAVALGEATKTVPYITDALKAYVFTVRLGQATNTDDAEGEVIATSDQRPTDAEIEAALAPFVGDIMQVPPQFSAVKIDGQRAYKLAREGEEMDIAARPLFVDSLVLLERPDADHVTLEMVCGKGGYVRAIARDLGAALGCYGHVRELRRTWSGPFDVDDSVSFEHIEANARTPELDAHLLPLQLGLADLPELRATAEGAAKLRHGNPGMVIAANVEFGDECWASFEGTPVAVGTYRAGELHPSRVFNLPQA
ncbi:tRNA pseudouridine(55) synthase TruB [Pseudooceanicola sediminis]|uniref:tRNA pseudouridine synthase B n=1 Tax=Pseudooceanicola sediminis TaxID=2211117 RepID=A0A399IZC9_9RHOB|nr:tRNA pseudouridine(55) synthase TruB [Pseudooceanicola sediminis]KAA2313407.1 tRNA pseudouridine(55) synthase TruB [Puniceibacterium sp. HSS470]RII38314.1 tRNA pseudouridine(55) synthase TruB [Pseudooceanicola sediminis]|tara:strand:- start:64697 stop:65611 length:915 start_codon:yes stop_codon:yes gene_type:complete